MGCGSRCSPSCGPDARRVRCVPASPPGSSGRHCAVTVFEMTVHKTVTNSTLAAIVVRCPLIALSSCPDVDDRDSDARTLNIPYRVAETTLRNLKNSLKARYTLGSPDDRFDAGRLPRGRPGDSSRHPQRASGTRTEPERSRSKVDADGAHLVDLSRGCRGRARAARSRSNGQAAITLRPSDRRTRLPGQRHLRRAPAPRPTTNGRSCSRSATAISPTSR